ncbi:MAG: hypothetical protein Q9159_004125 [Coniocarpon cinnabarinum]
MAAGKKPSRPLTRENVVAAHERIKRYVHCTPVLTSQSLSKLASNPQDLAAFQASKHEISDSTSSDGHHTPAHPTIRLFFKCENQQRIGAFKARGAFHALSRLFSGQLEKGVITHSSGNHAQALALAARERNIKSYIVMPTISTPSKIAATQALGASVHFSGSTAPEREALVAKIQEETGAVLVPPYDDAEIVLGQGTAALEFEGQVKEMTAGSGSSGEGGGFDDGPVYGGVGSEGLDAVIAPCGGGGLLSGTATALANTGIKVFGAEPSFQGADDCRRGLLQGERIPHVSTLTIADGVRTPVGEIPWSVISDPQKVHGVFAVSEDEIKMAMRLLFERGKCVVEPSGALGLAVVLFNEEFRRMVEREAGPEGWNIGIILSGGNMTMEKIAELYAPAPASSQPLSNANGAASDTKPHQEDVKHNGAPSKHELKREVGVEGMNGEKVAEDVAG